MVTAILIRTGFVESIFMNQLVYLGIASPALVLGILSMIAGIILIDKCTPFFDFHELFRGDGLSKLSGAIILFGILIALGMIIQGAF
jgi:hypothetical protein